MTRVGNYAFYECSSLAEITLPASVTRVGEYAFSNCTNLRSFICLGAPQFADESMIKDFPYEMETIHAPANIFNVSEEYWSICPNQLNDVKVTGGTLTENSFAVINRSYKTLNKLDLSNAENTALSDKALYECYSLNTLHLPSNLQVLGYKSVAECRMLKEITIPASVTEIGDAAFENCRLLNRIVFANSTRANENQLKRIGNWAFYNCHELQHLVIPEGVTEVGAAAFYGCAYLADLTLPSTVQYMGDNCFALCSQLSQITLQASIPPAIAAKTFDEVDSAIPVFVPKGSLASYKSDAHWSSFTNIKELGGTGIEDATLEAGKDYTIQGNEIILNTQQAVQVFTITGQQVFAGVADRVTLPQAGAYVLRIGNSAAKIMAY